MQPQQPCLSIDYGAACVRGVLVWPGGRWTALAFDGGFELSSAVYVDKGKILVGAAAWRRAQSEPAGFVLSPLRAGTGELTVAGTEVPVADLVAASLRHVADEAARVAGAAIDDVRMVVPAGWGPRRRTWLRHAARTAGLGQPRLVEAPVAAATRLTTETTPAGALVLVVDVGAGCEVTVLRHRPAGFEVLSTLADPGAGGDHIDALLAAAITGTDLDDVAADRRWTLLANLRATKHALTQQVVVTMPMPGGDPPMIVNTALLEQAAQPVFDRVGALAAEAIVNADLDVADIQAVHAVGASIAIPGAAQMIAAKLGTTPQPAPQPGFTAVLGAADASTPDPSNTAAPAAAAGAGLPPLRRLTGLALSGVASLLLYGHFVFTADFHNGTPTSPGRYYYVLATWGELAMACILAMITLLKAGSLLAALLDHRSAEASAPAAAGSRITAGLAVATAAGLAVAALYAITAAVFFARPVGTLLRWSVLPILPTTVCAIALIAVVWRRQLTPAAGWDSFLAFPISSVLAATIGTLFVTLWWHGHAPAWLNGWTAPIGYAGGLLIGVAIACALVRHLITRFALAVLLSVFCLIISQSGPGILAVIYALATAVWWGYHTWTLAGSRNHEPAGPQPAIR